MCLSFIRDSVLVRLYISFILNLQSYEENLISPNFIIRACEKIENVKIEKKVMLLYNGRRETVEGPPKDHLMC